MRFFAKGDPLQASCRESDRVEWSQRIQAWMPAINASWWLLQFAIARSSILAAYFGFAVELTKARPLGPMPLTWIITGSRTSTKCGMFAGSV